MKGKILFLSIIVLSSIISCNSNEKDNVMPNNDKEVLSNVKVINKLDPVCQMPTSKHLKDTLTYDGKLYGFCSSNCKEEFKANPKNFIK